MSNTSSDLFPRLPGYEATRVIGTGHFGRVFLARQVRRGGRVVLKAFHPPATSTSDYERIRRRFRNEAKLLSRMSGSDHVVQVYDFVTDDQGKDFMVTEYVDGVSVADAIESQDYIPLSESIRVVIEAARAVHSANQQGVVHGDLKPENLMLTAGRGRVKVMDFGMTPVSLLDPAEDSESSMAGIHHLSPEQVGDGEGIDHLTDVYSLCSILFTLACGRPPHVAEDRRSLREKILKEDPPVPSTLREGVPQKLDALILKGLSRNPRDRFHSAQELEAELETVIVQLDTPTVPNFAPLGGVSPFKTPIAAPMLEDGVQDSSASTPGHPDSTSSFEHIAVKESTDSEAPVHRQLRIYPPERNRQGTGALLAISMVIVLVLGAMILIPFLQ